MKHALTAKRLAEALDRKGMKAKELMDKSGVSKASISQYINGAHAPSNISAGKMAKVLGVSPVWLMGFDVPMYDTERYEKAAAAVREALQHRSALGITNEEWELIEAFRYLNQIGQEKSMQYVVDLTAIDRYRNEENDSEYIRF